MLERRAWEVFGLYRPFRSFPSEYPPTRLRASETDKQPEHCETGGLGAGLGVAGRWSRAVC